MQNGTTRIYRDRFGVPHIVGNSLGAAYFGLGYCAAQDRPRTLPLHQLFVQGRLAERLGNRELPDSDLPFLNGFPQVPLFPGYGGHGWPLNCLVSLDRWMRLWDFYGIAREGVAKLGDRSSLIVHAFCDGVNHYYDRVGRPDGIEPYEPAAEIAWWLQFEHTISVGFFLSNAFAITPERSADGAAWLGSDPHYWFLDGHSEAHILTPKFELCGVWDGHVNLGMWSGTNRSLAVAMTAAGSRDATVYSERLNPENREEYWDWRSDSYRRLEAHIHRVKISDGESDVLVARRTHHGPVIAEALVDGRPTAYTVRSVILEHAATALDQYLDVWTAATVGEFHDLMIRSPFVRGHRLAADRQGNIGYVCAVPVARRDDRIDWSRPVDGAIPDTEWQEEFWRPGTGEGDLPMILNPDSGFLQSANDPPWVVTTPQPEMQGFPEYVFPEGWRQLGTRGARQRDILRGERRLDQSSCTELVLDTFVPKAYYGIQALRRSFQALSERREAPALSADARRLDQILATWDGNATTDTPAMTAAFYLNRILREGIPDAEIRMQESRTDASELTEPNVSDDRGYDYSSALEFVARLLVETYGVLEKPWGDVHVIERLGQPFGVSGGCNELRALFGTFRGWWYAGDELDSDGVERCDFGSRTPRVMRVASNGITVHSVVATGQVPSTEHPDSPHIFDQLTLYATRQLKRLPLTLKEIEQDARPEEHAQCNHEAVEIVRRRT